MKQNISQGKVAGCKEEKGEFVYIAYIVHKQFQWENQNSALTISEVFRSN